MLLCMIEVVFTSNSLRVTQLWQESACWQQWLGQCCLRAAITWSNLRAIIGCVPSPTSDYVNTPVTPYSTVQVPNVHLPIFFSLIPLLLFSGQIKQQKLLLSLNHQSRCTLLRKNEGVRRWECRGVRCCPKKVTSVFWFSTPLTGTKYLLSPNDIVIYGMNPVMFKYLICSPQNHYQL